MNELYGILALLGIFCSLVTTYLLFFISKGSRRYSNRLLAIVLLEAGGYFLIRLLLLSGSIRESVPINWVSGVLLFSIAPCSVIYIRSVRRQRTWLICYAVLVSLIGLGPFLAKPWIGAMAYAFLCGGLLLKPGILFGGSGSLPVSSGESASRVMPAVNGEKAVPEPEAVKASLPPKEVKAAVSPEEVKTAISPEEVKAAISRKEVKAATPAEEGRTETLPEDEKAATSAEDTKAVTSPEDATTETGPEISKPLFDETQLQEQMTRVSTFISANHSFKRKGLTLAGLAVELSIPQHRLSYIIKHGYKQQFNDFINQHRVDYIKEKMSSCDDWKKMTLDAVGLDAGFSSRSTFFAVFKKITGQTPSEFARRLKEE
jgi:AraC-like DNA-binding protein